MNEQNSEFIETVIELQALNLTSGSISITGFDMDDDSEIIDNVLPGKYRVFKHVTNNNGDITEGNLFILHERFVDPQIPLHDYPWEEGGSFDSQDDAVKIFDAEAYSESLTSRKLTEKLKDSMAEIIDDTACFNMLYADYGYEFDIIKNTGKVVGIRVCDIGSRIDTPNRLFLRACQEGNLEKVKYYLHSPEIQNHADITTENYACYYWACTEGHKELIQYFLYSPELKHHCSLGTRGDTPFTILCNGNWKLAEEILRELPMKNILEAKEILNRFNTITEVDKIREIIVEREYEELNKEIEKKDMNKLKLKIKL